MRACRVGARTSWRHAWSRRCENFPRETGLRYLTKIVDGIDEKCSKQVILLSHECSPGDNAQRQICLLGHFVEISVGKKGLRDLHILVELG